MITDPFIPKLEEAEASARRGMFGKAIAIYSEILHRDPRHLGAQQGLARLRPYLTDSIDQTMATDCTNKNSEKATKISRSAPPIGLTKLPSRLNSNFFLRQCGEKGFFKYGLSILVIFICAWWLLQGYRSENITARAQEQTLTISRNQSPYVIPQNEPQAIWEEVLYFQKENRPLYAFYRARHLTKLDQQHPEAATLVKALRDRLSKQDPIKKTAQDIDKYILNQQFTEIQAYTESLLGRKPNDPTALALHAYALTRLSRAAFKAGDDKATEAFLKLGRAIFPDDLIWDVRLSILEDLRRTKSKKREAMLDYFG